MQDYRHHHLLVRHLSHARRPCPGSSRVRQVRWVGPAGAETLVPEYQQVRASSATRLRVTAQVGQPASQLKAPRSVFRRHGISCARAASWDFSVNHGADAVLRRGAPMPGNPSAALRASRPALPAGISPSCSNGPPTAVPAITGPSTLDAWAWLSVEPADHRSHVDQRQLRCWGPVSSPIAYNPRTLITDHHAPTGPVDCGPPWRSPAVFVLIGTAMGGWPGQRPEQWLAARGILEQPGSAGSAIGPLFLHQMPVAPL